MGLDCEWEERLTRYRWVPRCPGCFAYRCRRAASVSGQRGLRHQKEKLRHRRATRKQGDRRNPKMSLIDPQRTPRSSEAGMSRHWDTREFP